MSAKEKHMPKISECQGQDHEKGTPKTRPLIQSTFKKKIPQRHSPARKTKPIQYHEQPKWGKKYVSPQQMKGTGIASHRAKHDKLEYKNADDAAPKRRWRNSAFLFFSYTSRPPSSQQQNDHLISLPVYEAVVFIIPRRSPTVNPRTAR